MERIETAFIGNEQKYYKARSQTYGQAKNIDRRIKRVLSDIPDGNGKVIFEHMMVGLI
jgi:hypothetical protein